jgi:hypothetical protein
VREVAERTRQVAQAWLKDRENAVANPHFADFRYQDLSTGLIFDRDQIAEIVTRVREKLASQAASPAAMPRSWHSARVTDDIAAGHLVGTAAAAANQDMDVAELRK